MRNLTIHLHTTIARQESQTVLGISIRYS